MTGVQTCALPICRTNKFAVLGTIYHLNDKTDLDIGWRRSLGAKPVSNTMGVGLTLHW